MAVKDEDVFRPTESLIAPRPRRHYRTPVTPKNAHWQLRSFVGAEQQHLVYFPTGPSGPTGSDRHEINRLNIKTREIEVITRLSFSPKSLVAERGWICCGGEHGDFSAIHVDDTPAEAVSPEHDPILPSLVQNFRDSFESELFRLQSSIFQSLNRARAGVGSGTRKPSMAKRLTFGKERVNCVTLWFPPTLFEPCTSAYDQPVAVLANNDKTVTVVSLQDNEFLTDIEYPDCVNRAVISPDGRLLLAICDDPYLYVHERNESYSASASSLRSRAIHQWKFRGRKHLKSQRTGDTTDSRGSFALCFSSTGNLLAVGTQYGSISIYDPSLLTTGDDSCLLMTIQTSRPETHVGAVRDMAFAPGAVDLLAWTEDRGRVGVADLRSGLVQRQILYLDKPDSYDYINLAERSTIDPRLLDPEHASDGTDVEPGVVSMDTTSEGSASGPDGRLVNSLALARRSARSRRPLSRSGLEFRDNFDNQNRAAVRAHRLSGVAGTAGERTERAERADRDRRLPDRALTPYETMILGVIQDYWRPPTQERRASEQRAAAISGAARNNNAETVAIHNNDTAGTRNEWRPIPSGFEQTFALIEQFNRELERHPTSNDTHELRRDGIARQWVSAARREEAALNRLRAANILRADEGINNIDGNGGSRRSDAAQAGQPRRINPTAVSTAAEATLDRRRRYQTLLAHPSTIPSGGGRGWTSSSVLDLDYPDVSGTGTGRNGPGGFAAGRPPVPGTSRYDADATNLVSRRTAVYPTASTPDPFDTAGLSWSANGHILFVGAVNGIYEFHVDTFARKFLPNLTMA